MAQTIWIHKLADAKDGTTYRALFCDSCAKNYNDGHARMAKEPVLA